MSSNQIQRIGVVGCGLMGSGIAEVCARAGLDVIVREVNAGAAEAGQQRITASLDQVNNAQMLAGTRMAKITRQQEALTSAQTQAKTMLSIVEDTDLEKVVTELKKKMLNLEANQTSFVKIADLSLFNYMS